MKFIKDIVCTFLYILLGIICFIAWFSSFMLGYILQGTWAGAVCFAVNIILGIAFVKIIGGNGAVED